MSALGSVPLTVAQAHTLLKQIDCLQPAGVAAIDRAQLRQALLQVAQQSDYQMLGICADSVAQGCQALQAYATALGYTPNLPSEAIDGAVYIKFNPRTHACYISSYSGEHRGVLVSCQSADEAGINEIYGHLPLNLFDS